MPKRPLLQTKTECLRTDEEIRWQKIWIEELFLRSYITMVENFYIVETKIEESPEEEHQQPLTRTPGSPGCVMDRLE